MLIKDYYTIEEQREGENATLFTVRLNPDCAVYQGHFPEQPVSPGVCNIQMLKELAEKLAGRELFMSNLSLCRLTTLITPHTHPVMQATVSLDGSKLRASLGNGEETYLEMKAEVS